MNVKKAEGRRTDAFELWCWRRLLRVPRTARRSNQSFLKEISPEYTGRTDAEAETPILWPKAQWKKAGGKASGMCAKGEKNKAKGTRN